VDNLPGFVHYFILWTQETPMAKILVLNGPNLNLLGSREPGRYGHRTLEEIMEELTRFAGACGHDLSHVQENSEGVLVEAVHKAAVDQVDYIIINPAAYTHTSIALRDALLGVRIPFVEVHLSAVSARESFRQISYFSDIAMGVISGFHGESYMLAMQAIINHIEP
jgi:3-dehydroquinate dehydratase-2